MGSPNPHVIKIRSDAAASTLAKATTREEARKLITAEIPRMLRAHVEHACGIGHLYTRLSEPAEDRALVLAIDLAEASYRGAIWDGAVISLDENDLQALRDKWTALPDPE